jgi:hypothetical protein
MNDRAWASCDLVDHVVGSSAGQNGALPIHASQLKIEQPELYFSYCPACGNALDWSVSVAAFHQS